MSTEKPKLWVPGDWNAFFGFGTNILVNLLTLTAMRPALEMFMTPVIGITCFAIILVSWFGGVRYRGIPAGLIAIGVGTVIAWASTAAGLNYGGLSVKGLTDSVANFGFHIPL